MDWYECNKKKIVKEVTADEGLIESLKKTSKNKLISQSRLELDEVTVSSKISLAYDSLRELLEALALVNGFKIYNHECYSSFLQEILKESSKADEFEEIRKMRNSINYYGKQVSVPEAKTLIERINALREKVRQLLENSP